MVLVLIAITFRFVSQDTIDETEQASNETIQPTEKVITDTGIGYNITSADVPKNSEIQFKVGEKFVYQTPKVESSSFFGKAWSQATTTYTIDGIERVDGRDCYLVTEMDNSTFVESGGRTPQSYVHVFRLCYDTETGRVLRASTKTMDGEYVIKDGAEELRADHSFFAYWMLGLDDNARWETLSTEVTPSLNMVEHGKDEFRVIQREMINGRESFKVEKKIIGDLDKKEVTGVDYYWVDVKKRIMVRWERYNGDMEGKYVEDNLLSEL